MVVVMYAPGDGCGKTQVEHARTSMCSQKAGSAAQGQDLKQGGRCPEAQGGIRQRGTGAEAEPGEGAWQPLQAAAAGVCIGERAQLLLNGTHRGESARSPEEELAQLTSNHAAMLSIGIQALA